jgi:hypothetical protein
MFHFQGTVMIRTHDFHSHWLGVPAGIVDDEALFFLPADRREELLRPFHFTEFRTRAPRLALRAALAESGFLYADSQLPFRIRLRELPPPAECDSALIQPASQTPFSLHPESLADFASERFSCLPGMTQSRLNQRYCLWGETLIRDSPGLCLLVRVNAVPQGYFLSQEDKGTIHLVLAGLFKNASLTGLDIYKLCLTRYAHLGYGIGHASISASNSAVLNLYAHLGARFLAPLEHYTHVANFSSPRR